MEPKLKTLHALLPEIKAACEEYDRQFDLVASREFRGDYQKILAEIATKCNETLVKAADAIVEDTRGVNSKDTIYMVWRPYNSHDLWFHYLTAMAAYRFLVCSCYSHSFNPDSHQKWLREVGVPEELK